MVDLASLVTPKSSGQPDALVQTDHGKHSALTGQVGVPCRVEQRPRGRRVGHLYRPDPYGSVLISSGWSVSCSLRATTVPLTGA